MKDNNSIHLPNLDSDEEIVISKRKIVPKPKFTMTGNKMKSINILVDLTKPEAFTFKLIHDKRDFSDNIALYSTKYLTPTEKVVFSKGYKLLNQKKLLIRISKGAESTYMFNPEFIIPNNYEEARAKWKSIQEPAR